MTKQKRKTILVYTLLITSYFFSLLLRMSAGITLPKLSESIPLTEFQMSLISGIFYYLYALMQPLMGATAESNSSMRKIVLGLFLTSFGTILFAYSEKIVLLVAARAIMGFGTAPIMCSILVYQHRNFDILKYSLLAGITMMAGNLGSLFATTPLLFSINSIGIKNTYLSIGIMLLAIAFLIMLINDKTSGITSTTRNAVMPIIKKSLAIAKSQPIRNIMLIMIITGGATTSLQGLWIFSWISNTYPSIPEIASSSVGLIFNLSIMAGNCLSSIIYKKKSNFIHQIGQSTLFMVLGWFIAVIFLALTINFGLAILAITILGITTGMANVQYASGIDYYSPSGFGGSVYGIINMFIFFSNLLFQWISGALISIFGNFISIKASFDLTYLLITLSVLAVYLRAGVTKSKQGWRK